MAQLAIKGHPTRGKEIIEILKMLGGINNLLQQGCGKGIYLINTCDSIIYYTLPKDIIYDLTIFTLEEFLEKFPYKVGDKVIAPSHNIHTIESIHWNGNEIYYNTVGEGFNTSYTAKDLQPYKEETMEVSEEFFDKYCKKCGSQRCTAEGEWLEGCKHYKEEIMEETIKINIPKGYEFAGVDDNNQQVVFEKIGCQYPKTYEECCNILKYSGNYYISLASKIDDRLFEAFYKLKVCRDAYWKIAGEQMGLGKPWEPDTCQVAQSIARYADEVVRHNDTYGGLFILEFPTKEMRDAFYENFKELIESCKELL